MFAICSVYLYVIGCPPFAISLINCLWQFIYMYNMFVRVGKSQRRITSMQILELRAYGFTFSNLPSLQTFAMSTKSGELVPHWGKTSTVYAFIFPLTFQIFTQRTWMSFCWCNAHSITAIFLFFLHINTILNCILFSHLEGWSCITVMHCLFWHE